MRPSRTSEPESGRRCIGSEHENDHSIVIHCALVPKSQVRSALRGFGFDLSVGEGRPSCWQSGDEVGYERFGNGSGIEPLVLVRIFHDHRPQTIDLWNSAMRRRHSQREFRAMSQNGIPTASQTNAIFRRSYFMVRISEFLQIWPMMS